MALLDGPRVEAALENGCACFDVTPLLLLESGLVCRPKSADPAREPLDVLIPLARVEGLKPLDARGAWGADIAPGVRVLFLSLT